MFKKTLMLLCVTTLTTFSLFAGKVPAPGPNDTLPANYKLYPSYPTVKVLIAKDLNCTTIEVDGAYRVFNPEDCTVSGYGLFGKKYPVHPTTNGLKWGEEFPGVYQFAIVPASAKTRIMVDGTAYPGSIFVFQVGNTINIVNQVKIEDYLATVLPSSVSENLNEEAMAALVIAARTDIYYQSVRFDKAFWQIDAHQACYRGYDGKRNKEVDHAINATRYLVMRMKDSPAYLGLFPATWSAHCAGKTASGSIVFRKPISGPKESVVSSVAESDREGSSWSYLVKKEDMAKVVGFKTLSKVSLYKDNVSGKVYAVRFQNGADSKEMDFVALQKLVGEDKIKSNDFAVDIQGNIVTFTGFGKGHGVGLCLYSANRLSEHGQDAITVLEKFFPGTEVVMMPTVQPAGKSTSFASAH
ncbi:MAG: SpoIID/LytB domain-containing protein [Chlamydiales bacterium]|nr:SpoIID/LytB domain-containing protein [Chlamydiales bacterium]